MANDGTVKIGIETDDSKFASGLKNLGKVAAVALTGASAAVGALAKESLDAYANYEQLIGGVETLFKESAGVVEEYANNAYRTAGLSANQYMETVTGFSASLLQSLGGDTAAAADLADQAIIDMADNANKMGTSMESIQNAYQGFAKQNYTMLDNLKLGYGGTKEEMERLLADAEQISGIHFDISSFADVVQAIHVVQEDLGIAGTTAEEAASTIQGSLSAMGSAWQNLVTGIADENADLDTLIDNFVDSVATAADNILPRLEQILNGFGELSVKLAPIIAEQLPQMIASVLPSLLGAGAQLMDGLIQGITSALPTLVAAAVPILLSLTEAILGQLPAIADAALQIIVTLSDGLSAALPTLIPTITDVILQIVETLTEPGTLNSLIEAALQIILALAEGLIKATPQLIEAVPQIIANLVEALIENGPVLGEAALELLIMLGEGLIAAIPQLLAYIVEIPAAIIGGIKDGLAGLADIGPEIVQNLLDSIMNMGDWLSNQISNFFGGIIDGVLGLLGIGGKSSGSSPPPSSRGGGFQRATAEPISLSDEDGGASAYGLARARSVSALESAIPNAQSRAAIATASMAPSAGYAAPTTGGMPGGGGGGQTPNIILRPNLVIRCEGDLAQLGQFLKPAIDDEDTRLGPGVK